MPFCTIVEFEWGENLDRERFESMAGGTDRSAPDGRLARIAGIDDTGAGASRRIRGHVLHTRLIVPALTGRLWTSRLAVATMA